MNSINKRLHHHYFKYHILIFCSVLMIFLLSLFLSRTNSVAIQISDDTTQILTAPIHQKLYENIQLLFIILMFMIFLISTTLHQKYIRQLRKDFEYFYTTISKEHKEVVATNYKYKEFNEIASILNHKIEYIETLTSSKDEYFSMTIHDLQTPLQLLHNTIKLYKANSDENNYIEIIETSVKDLDYEINRYLQLEKIEYFEKVTFEQFDIVLELRQYLKNHDICEFLVSIEDAPQQKIVKGDREIFSKIMSNLISNGLAHSIDHTIQIYITNEKLIFSNRVIKQEDINLFGEERIYSKNGHGLGTRIIKKYVELLEWEISSYVNNNIIYIEIELV